MLETMPLALALEASSAEDHRERGLPESLGNVQARAVIWARCIEGKKAGSAWARGFFNAGGLPPALAPFAHGAVRAAGLIGNGGIVPLRVFIGQKHDLGPDNLGVGSAFAQADKMPKMGEFLSGE